MSVHEYYFLGQTEGGGNSFLWRGQGFPSEITHKRTMLL